MRFLLAFTLLFNLNFASAQSQKDLITLEAKAREYLTQTYNKQNLDSAIKLWHDFVFLEIKDIYLKKGLNILDESSLHKKLKEDYQLFFKSNKHFMLIDFTDKTISDESKNPTVYFKYSYKESVNDKESINYSYIYFILDNKDSNWKIWDFRISEVLGYPKLWLK